MGGRLGLPSKAICGPPQYCSTGIIFRDIPGNNRSCGPKTDGEVGCRRGEPEETRWVGGEEKTLNDHSCVNNEL